MSETRDTSRWMVKPDVISDEAHVDRGRGCGIYLLVRDDDPGDHFVLRCRTWGCKICRGKKANRIKGHLIKVANEHRLTRMMTLTMYRGAHGHMNPNEYIMLKWNALRTRIRQRWPKFKYIWVREQHRDGYPHLHLAVSNFIPFRWLQAAWMKLGAGKFVNIKYFSPRRITRYLTKYISKGMLLRGHAKRTRRWGASRGLSLYKPSSPGGWHLATSYEEVEGIRIVYGDGAWEDYANYSDQRHRKPSFESSSDGSPPSSSTYSTSRTGSTTTSRPCRSSWDVRVVRREAESPRVPPRNPRTSPQGTPTST